MYYIFIGWAGAMFSLGLIWFRWVFYGLVERTTGMLNTVLDTIDDDSTKQKKLIGNLGGVLISLVQFIGAALVVLLITVFPVWIYSKLFQTSFNGLDLSSFWFYLALSIGSILVFWGYSKLKKPSDYSEWSKLLHRIILDNYNISRALFWFEMRLYKPKLSEVNPKFLIVTGLARAGTTAFTNALYESNKFYSLSYSNMPFLLSPNLWRYVYNPKMSMLRERSHGDKVLFGYNTIEALEEYFWKTELRDIFINPDTIEEHKISDENYKNYLRYQGLLKVKEKPDKIYLAKNNNFLARYESVRSQNPDFVLLMLIRDPFQHASSLLHQHKRQTRMQKEDKFILDFMNWLAHHEFGLNQKVFQFHGNSFRSDYPKESINYWIGVWCNYYSRVQDLPGSKSLHLISYEDFLLHPKELLEALGISIGIELSSVPIKKFDNPKSDSLEVDEKLAERATEIYTSLLSDERRIAAIQIQE